MKNLRLLLWLPVLFFVFSSCKKDKDPEPTKTDFLTSKVWKTTALTVSPAIPVDTTGTKLITDVFAYYASNGGTCINDDIKKFNKDKSYTFEEGATKCNASSPTVFETGTWTFNTDESVLVLSVPGYTPTNYTLSQIDATTLKYTYTQTYSLTGGGTATFTFTETLSNQ